MGVPQADTFEWIDWPCYQILRKEIDRYSTCKYCLTPKRRFLSRLCRVPEIFNEIVVSICNYFQANVLNETNMLLREFEVRVRGK